MSQIHALKDAFKELPEETKGNVEKKQARTYEELLAEQAEQDQVGSSTTFVSCERHLLLDINTCLGPQSGPALELVACYHAALGEPTKQFGHLSYPFGKPYFQSLS